MKWRPSWSTRETYCKEVGKDTNITGDIINYNIWPSAYLGKYSKCELQEEN